MVAVGNLVAYKEVMRKSEKSKWKLTLMEKVDFIEKNNTRTETALPLGKDALPNRVV